MLKKQFNLLLILVAGAVHAATAPPRDQERPAIPADLRFEFKAVPAEDNGIINWRRAAAIEVVADDHLTDILRYCWTPIDPEPSDEDLDTLRSWLRRNKEALALFEASLLKPKNQWPEQNPQNRQPEMSALSHLIRARLLEADLLAREHQFTNAVLSLEGSLKLTQVGIESDAAMIQYVLSTAARTLVQRAMVRLATRSEVPEGLLVRLLKDLPPLNSETNAISHAFRVEFSRDAGLAIDVHRLAESWSKISETNSALLLYPEELRRPFKVLLDPLLVATHPKPYDQAAGLKGSISHYRVFLTNCVSAWTNRNESVQEDREETIERLKTDIQPLMEIVKDEPLPLSKQAADRARNAYLKIKNPIGRIFSGEISAMSDYDVRVFRCRTEREAVRATIGLLLFERQKGILPAKLSDLVEAKILDSAPFDYFADAPFSYSRERRIVWSVGQDVVNDDGEDEGGGKLPSWEDGDAVWRIPSIK